MVACHIMDKAVKRSVSNSAQYDGVGFYLANADTFKLYGNRMTGFGNEYCRVLD